jgi:hypothetical protein
MLDCMLIRGTPCLCLCGWVGIEICLWQNKLGLVLLSLLLLWQEKSAGKIRKAAPVAATQNVSIP